MINLCRFRLQAIDEVDSVEKQIFFIITLFF